MLIKWDTDNWVKKVDVGLCFDDMLPVETETVTEALRRLPPQEARERQFRVRRAIMLTIKQAELEKGEWSAADVNCFHFRTSLIWRLMWPR